MGKYAILFYIPNLIGYSRVACTVLACVYAFSNWKIAFIAHAMDHVLDAVDGWAARKFNQCSRFGAVLDMITDRVSTFLWMVILSHLYPDSYLMFFFFGGLDYASHWWQMYSSALSGASTHKGGDNIILRIYYKAPGVLFCCVAAQEGVMSLWYMEYFAKKEIAANPTYQMVFDYSMYFCIFFFAFKQVANVFQLCSAVSVILSEDYATEQKEKKRA